MEARRLDTTTGSATAAALAPRGMLGLPCYAFCCRSDENAC